MGDAINMAARLMCLDDAKNTILCDERTYNLCSSLFKFKTLGDKFVKGKSSAIAVFQLTDYIDDMNSPIKDSIEPSIFIGRSIERKLIEGIINDKEAKCLLFEADGGQGLTSLANFLLERLDAENITSWYMLFKFSPIKSTQSDRSKPFFLIHTLMWKLIDIVDTCKTSAEGLILPQRFAAKRDPFVSSSLSTREWLQPGEEQDTQTTLQTGGRRPSDGISSKRPSTAAAFGASAFRRKSLDMPIGGAGRKSLKRPDELSLLPAIPGIRKSAFPLAMPDMAEETYLQDNMAEETYLQDNISSGFYDGFDTKAANLLTFDKLIYNVMRKLGMQTKYYHILCEINETFLDDNDTEVASRLRGIAISEVILICLDHLSRRNKFALVLSDFQYSDIHSIEIIDKILNESCKVCIFFFCRPGWTYESEDTNALIVKMKQSSRLKESKIEAFSLEDTSLLVLEVWANPSITTVNQKITESILNRTSGNPFFIKSLAIHMKESGQWRISPMGELQPKAGTLDNDNLALGYDNQGIILGHFDRIDRNLQLFLKVAAVLGLKWSLDDVLFFITGIMNLSAKVDNICYTTIINGITTNDRYGFIRTISTNENDTGAWFSFKSPIIRKCIYTLMAQKQRQQVHLFAAQYYESKLTEFNKQKYLIKIMEHYSETDATQLDNKFLYYRMVAKYYYDHGYSAEAVVYYRILLQITETYHEKAESDLIMSSWYREYGESLFYRGNMSDAYLAIIKSLQLMNFYLPEHGIHFFLKLRSLKSNWMKLFETSFLDNAEAVDYSIEMLNSKNGMDSVPYLSGDTTNQFSKKNDRYSSGNVLSKSVIARASIVGSIPDRAKPAMNVSSEDIFESGAIAKQHALQILAEIFLHQREYDYFTYVIMYAVTLYTVGLPTLMMARILSLASLMVAGSSDKPHDNEYAKKCMQWAFILDDRADLQTSLLITNNKGILCFLMGQLGQSLKYLHISSRISRSLCNLPSQFKALRLRCAISFLSIGRKYCEASAHEMIALSQRYEIWEGKFWGLFHVINVLFLEENSSVKLQDKSKELEILWNDGPQYFKTQPLIKIAYLSLHASLPLFIFKNFMNEPGNLPEHLKEVPSIFSAIQQLDWEFVECIKPLIFGFFAVLSHKKASAHSSAAIIIHKICELINDLLKKLTGLKIRHNLRTIFKGLSLLACGKHSKAVAAWKKGLDANSECLWHQGVLLVSIGHFGSQVDDVGSMDAGRKLMKTLYCSNFHSVLKRFS
jgi:tetratricopeptide (TPR) repeat protein